MNLKIHSVITNYYYHLVSYRFFLLKITFFHCWAHSPYYSWYGTSLDFTLLDVLTLNVSFSPQKNIQFCLTWEELNKVSIVLTYIKTFYQNWVLVTWAFQANNRDPDICGTKIFFSQFVYLECCVQRWKHFFIKSQVHQKPWPYAICMYSKHIPWCMTLKT